MILAHWLVPGPDVFGKKPDQAIQIRSRLVLHNMIQAFFGRMVPNQMREVRSSIYIYTIWPDSGCTLAVMAITKTFVNQMWHVYWVAGMVLHQGLVFVCFCFCQVHHCGGVYSKNIHPSL